MTTLERKMQKLENENKIFKQQAISSEQRYREIEHKYTLIHKQNEDLARILKNSNKSDELNRILAQACQALSLQPPISDRNIVMMGQKMPTLEHTFVHIQTPSPLLSSQRQSQLQHSDSGVDDLDMKDQTGVELSNQAPSHVTQLQSYQQSDDALERQSQDHAQSFELSEATAYELPTLAHHDDKKKDGM